MYGLGTSAAGAGLAGDASRNFNIDWQNQQLQRQDPGALGAYGTEQGQGREQLWRRSPTPEPTTSTN